MLHSLLFLLLFFDVVFWDGNLRDLRCGSRAAEVPLAEDPSVEVRSDSIRELHDSLVTVDSLLLGCGIFDCLDDHGVVVLFEFLEEGHNVGLHVGPSVKGGSVGDGCAVLSEQSDAPVGERNVGALDRHRLDD